MRKVSPLVTSLSLLEVRLTYGFDFAIIEEKKPITDFTFTFFTLCRLLPKQSIKAMLTHFTGTLLLNNSCLL